MHVLPELMPVAEARQRLAALFQPVCETETVPLAQALGRVLARPIHTAMPLPPFDNASMDGFAVRASDTQGATSGTPVTLKVIGESLAGRPFTGEVGPGEAVRINTGAAIPAGADAVIPVEHTDAPPAAPGLPYPKQVALFRAVAPGTFIRPAGQDLPAGAQVIPGGVRLRPQEIGMLAMVGLPEVAVWRRPRVAILPTGDELRPPHEPLGFGEIHESNGHTLAALAQTVGAEPLLLDIVPDTAEAVRQAFLRAVEQGADLILTTGGVSLGSHDFVRLVLQEEGHLALWRVNMRPGRPLAAGRFRGVPVVALPGNPVSAFVSFEVFLRPALHRMAGVPHWQRPTLRVRLAEDVTSDGRESYLRAVLTPSDQGWEARLTGHQGSGNLHSLVLAQALVVIPPQVTHLPAGAEVEAWPLAAEMGGI